jgi:predicted membrane chloride channel (bestrophin family)
VCAFALSLKNRLRGDVEWIDEHEELTNYLTEKTLQRIENSGNRPQMLLLMLSQFLHEKFKAGIITIQVQSGVDVVLVVFQYVL